MQIPNSGKVDEMNATLLRKIEALTLYILEQDKKTRASNYLSGKTIRYKAFITQIEYLGKWYYHKTFVR